MSKEIDNEVSKACAENLGVKKHSPPFKSLCAARN